jgi:hypothetical protein
LEHGGLGAASEPYREFFPAVGAVVRLLRGHVSTCAWVAGRLARFMGRFLVFFEFLERTEASIGLAFAHQFVGVFLVQGQPFGLSKSALCWFEAIQRPLPVCKAHRAHLCRDLPEL